MHPKVSIIILNWNGLEDTIECLESVKNITYPNYQVIVVDNGSEGDDVGILRQKFGDYIHVIENDRNYGFALGNNIGMRYALVNLAPDYLLLLNNDTVVDRDFLTQLVRAAESDSGVGLLGPAVYDYHHPSAVRETGAGLWMSWWRGTQIPVMPDNINSERGHIREVDYVEGSCMMVRRELLEKVGMLDEEYFAYWEETDWCVRARNHGYKIYVTLASKIWHKPQPFSMNTVKLYYFLRNNILFMRKNADTKHMIVFLAYFILVGIPLYSFKPFLRHPLGTTTAVAKALLWNIRHQLSKR